MTESIPEEKGSVIADLFSDCCGNIQTVLDNTCLDTIGNQDPVMINVDSHFVDEKKDDDLVLVLPKLFRDDFVYDFSPESIPYIHPLEEEDILTSATLANRKQIYYSCYLASSEEKQKVKTTIEHLKANTHDDKNYDVELVGRIPQDQSRKRLLSNLIFNNEIEKPDPVLIKKGPVMIQHKNSICNEKNMNSSRQAIRCNYINLILLNRFIILPVANNDVTQNSFDNESNESSGKKIKSGGLWKKDTLKKKTLKKKYRHQAIPILSITKIVDLGLCRPVIFSSNDETKTKKWSIGRRKEPQRLEDDDDFSKSSTTDLLGAETFHDSSFRIDVEDGPSFTFICTSPLHKTLWLHAIRHAIIGTWCREYRIREDSEWRDIGWQHHIILTNIYAACCCGDIQMLHRTLENPLVDVTKLGSPDASGFTAIHYAVIKNHNPCLVQLLKFGFNPNIKDRNMLTAADHAAHTRNESALEILSRHNCFPSEINQDTRSITSSPQKYKKFVTVKQNMMNNESRLLKMHDTTSQLKAGCAEYQSILHQVAISHKNGEVPL